MILDTKSIHKDECSYCGYWWRCLEIEHFRQELFGVPLCLLCLSVGGIRIAREWTKTSGVILACECGGVFLSTKDVELRFNYTCWACLEQVPTERNFPPDPRLINCFSLLETKKACNCNACRGRGGKVKVEFKAPDWREFYSFKERR